MSARAVKLSNHDENQLCWVIDGSHWVLPLYRVASIPVDILASLEKLPIKIKASGIVWSLYLSKILRKAFIA
jgi:hypothetical protein